MDILIDVGGSSIRIKRHVDGALEKDTETFKGSTDEGVSREDFYEHIRLAAEVGNSSGQIDGIAVSLAGEYDYVNDNVVSCYWNRHLVGKLKDDLKNRFNCEDVFIVNDGDAHALAYKDSYDRQGKEFGGAVNLSLGTSVGFGLIDRRGNLIHNCEGHNWEVSNWETDIADADNKQLYSALGTQGLQNLERNHQSPECYIFYGQHLCHFLAHDIIPVFHPQCIGLSGGIVTNHEKEINEGIDRECKEYNLRSPGQPLHGIQIDLLPGEDNVMQGLARLLYKRRMWESVFSSKS